jgi:hypothetical protein
MERLSHQFTKVGRRAFGIEQGGRSKTSIPVCLVAPATLQTKQAYVSLVGWDPLGDILPGVASSVALR